VTLPLVVERLTPPESIKLGELESTIQRGLSTFVAVGAALVEIRDARLYRAEYGTFEDYCRRRWQIERRQAYRLMEAAAAVENVSHGTQRIPDNERQTRPLTRLEPEQQREAWHRALEISPAPTAEVVEEAVREVEGKPSMAVHYSSESPEWYTPSHVLSAVESVLGIIDLDPCSNPKPYNVPALNHLTADDDGLSKEWTGRVYMNPPYGDGIGKWIAKLREEYDAGRVQEAIALIPARTDTQWFQPLFEYPCCFVSGRLKFSNSGSAPFPSVLVYLGVSWEKFASTFREIGKTTVLYA
jgi:hypothetical protein